MDVEVSHRPSTPPSPVQMRYGFQPNPSGSLHSSHHWDLSKHPAFEITEIRPQSRTSVISDHFKVPHQSDESEFVVVDESSVVEVGKLSRPLDLDGHLIDSINSSDSSDSNDSNYSIGSLDLPYPPSHCTIQ